MAALSLRIARTENWELRSKSRREAEIPSLCIARPQPPMRSDLADGYTLVGVWLQALSQQAQ